MTHEDLFQRMSPEERARIEHVDCLLDRADRAEARVAELDAAMLRADERHAESMRSVRLRAEAAEREVKRLRAAIREAHGALMASPENDLHAINVLGAALAKGQETDR